MKNYNKKERPQVGDTVVTGGNPSRKTYDEAFRVLMVLENMELLKVAPLVISEKLVAHLGGEGSESFLPIDGVRLASRGPSNSSK